MAYSTNKTYNEYADGRPLGEAVSIRERDDGTPEVTVTPKPAPGQDAKWYRCDKEKPPVPYACLEAANRLGERFLEPKAARDFVWQLFGETPSPPPASEWVCLHAEGFYYPSTSWYAGKTCKKVGDAEFSVIAENFARWSDMQNEANRRENAARRERERLVEERRLSEARQSQEVAEAFTQALVQGVQQYQQSRDSQRAQQLQAERNRIAVLQEQAARERQRAQQWEAEQQTLRQQQRQEQLANDRAIAAKAQAKLDEQAEYERRKQFYQDQENRLNMARRRADEEAQRQKQLEQTAAQIRERDRVAAEKLEHERQRQETLARQRQEERRAAEAQQAAINERNAQQRRAIQAEVTPNNVRVWAPPESEFQLFAVSRAQHVSLGINVRFTVYCTDRDKRVRRQVGNNNAQLDPGASPKTVHNVGCLNGESWRLDDVSYTVWEIKG